MNLKWMNRKMGISTFKRGKWKKKTEATWQIHGTINQIIFILTITSVTSSSKTTTIYLYISVFFWFFSIWNQNQNQGRTNTWMPNGPANKRKRNARNGDGEGEKHGKKTLQLLQSNSTCNKNPLRNCMFGHTKKLHSQRRGKKKENKTRKKSVHAQSSVFSPLWSGYVASICFTFFTLSAIPLIDSSMLYSIWVISMQFFSPFSVASLNEIETLRNLSKFDIFSSLLIFGLD